MKKHDKILNEVYGVGGGAQQTCGVHHNNIAVSRFLITI